MTNPESENDGDLGKGLDKLIALAGRLRNKPFRRPSDDTIDAYLLGTATESQKAEVQSALRASSAFRKEMLVYAADLDRLGDEEIRAAMDSVVVESPPAEAHLCLGANQPTLAPEGATKGRSYPRKQNWFLPALATAGVVILVGIVAVKYSETTRERLSPVTTVHDSIAPASQLPTPLVELSVVDGLVPPELLADNTTRAITSSDSQSVTRWADSTALQAIRTLLELDQNTYVFHILQQSHAPAKPQIENARTLQFVDSSQTVIESMSYVIPASADSAKVWVLGLKPGPKYVLYCSPLGGDNQRLLWTKSMGESAVATVTYQLRGRHQAGVTTSFSSK